MQTLSVAAYRRFAPATGLVAGWLLLAASAAAQQGEFRLLLEGEAGVRDDGNYGEEQDVLLRQDATRGYTGLNLELSYALQRLNLALNYAPSYERSLEDSEVSGTTHRLDFGLVGDLSRRSRLSVREQLLSLPNIDPYESVAAPITTVATRRGDQLIHYADVTLDNAVSRRSSVSLGLSHGLRIFEEEDFVDSETLEATLGAGWDLERGRRIEASASVATFDYGDKGESDVLTFGLAFATELWRDTLLRLEAGGYSVESRLPLFLLPPPVPGLPPGTEPQPVPGAGELREEDEGWRGSLQFSQQLRLFRWGLGLSHDISAGAGLGRAVEADNAFVDISWPLGREWEIGFDGNASRQTDVSDSFLVEGQTMEALTEFAAGTARVSWNFSPAFRLAGSYSRVWQSSEVENFADLAYSRYFLSLAFRLYSTGETPREPASLGRPIDDDEPDTQ